MAAKALPILALCYCALSAAAAARPGLLQTTATNPCSGQKDGAVVPAGTCSAYFHTCDGNGNIVLPDQHCDAPLVFNPNATPAGCSEIGAVGVTGCNCASRWTGDMLTACQLCQSKQKVGDFAFPGAPNRKFAQCAVDSPHVGDCGSGLVFCEKQDACLRPGETC